MSNFLTTVENDLKAVGSWVVNEVEADAVKAWDVIKSTFTYIAPEVFNAVADAFDAVLVDLEQAALAEVQGNPVGKLGTQIMNSIMAQKPALAAQVTPQVLNAVTALKAISIGAAQAAAGAAVSAVAGPIAGVAAAEAAGNVVKAAEGG